MATLILVILTSKGVTTNTINFSSESACLKAISRVIDMEQKNSLTIKARCVKYEL